jgi:hypothetical protein
MLIAGAQVFLATVVTCLILLPYLALLFLVDLVVKARSLILLSVAFQNVTLVLPVKHVMARVQGQSLVLPHSLPVLVLVRQIAYCLLQVVLVVKPFQMAFAFRADRQQRHALDHLALHLSQSAFKQITLLALVHLEGLNVCQI